jgi:nucleoside triphosphatase
MKKISIATGVLIFNNKSEIFLAKSSGKWGSNWCVPGGHLEYGETMESCVVREVLEETGLNITDIEFISIQESIFPKERVDEKHFIFLNYKAKTKTVSAVLNEEHNEYIWINPREAIKNLPLNPTTIEFIKQVID